MMAIKKGQAEDQPALKTCSSISETLLDEADI